MCFPLLAAPVMMGIMAAMTVASTALTAYGQYRQGKQQEAMYEYNAKVAKIQATDAERRGSMAEAAARMRAQVIEGAMHAGQGASGVVAGEYSGADILAQTAEFGGRDAAMARINAGREAWG